MTPKGQVTVPRSVREALGIKADDQVVFRVEGDRVVMAKTSWFLDLDGTIAVPAATRNVAWDEILRRTRSDTARARRGRRSSTPKDSSGT